MYEKDGERERERETDNFRTISGAIYRLFAFYHLFALNSLSFHLFVRHFFGSVKLTI